MEDELYHYGKPHSGSVPHSGRYLWGSGDSETTIKAYDFLSSVKALESKGLSEKDVATALNMSTTELRQQKSNAKNARKADLVARATRLKENKQYSNAEIGKLLASFNDGVALNESTVRLLLKDNATAKLTLTENTKNCIKDNVDSKKYIDIGAGVELDMGVTRTRFNNAVAMLKEEGYKVQYVNVEQVSNPGNYTSIKVLTKPDVEYSELYKNKKEIGTITDYMVEGGEAVRSTKYPESISRDRVYVRYAEDGGADRDGTIEIRRGVEDCSLGNSSYAQVRIAVDNKMYMKGMAYYSDDIPKGYDIVYNSNKTSDKPDSKVFKPLKTVDGKEGSPIDQENPFGALIKAGGQMEYTGADGKQHLGVVNKLKEEGEWENYSKNLPSQFLSKQPISLINKQLNLSLANKKAEYDEIMSLDNPSIKKKLLESFADDCDASAVSLKAASLPGQTTKVLLPVPTLKDNEVYAPTFRNGDTVVLVRFPHAGTFEIPELVVNNRQKDAKNALGNAKDAIGINPRVAERLSGADFDGDTALIIPCNSSSSNVRITTSAPLKGLVGFDPKSAYPAYEGMPKMKSQTKQTEMGKISNLITDMTLKGATPDEMARAVRHSMVVIDAEKHNLNYKQSAIDNGIDALKEKYQGGGGAGTLISRAKGEVRVRDRVEGKLVTDPVTGTTKRQYIDPETGKKLYEETGSSYTTKKVNKKTGEVTEEEHFRTIKSTKMYEADDARELSSGHYKEEAYANYANALKSLGNQARKETLSLKPVSYNPDAKKEYKDEVDSLNRKLTRALKNAPKERQAQLAASVEVETKKKANPDMTKEELKKARVNALASARARFGAGKERVDITEKEWTAINKGAISGSKLDAILNNSDLDKVKKLATPKSSTTLSSAQASRISAMNRSGYTIAEISEQLGVSTSTVSKYM